MNGMQKLLVVLLTFVAAMALHGESYRLKAGDTIKIRYVLGAEGIVPVGPTEMELEIPPGGTVTVPYAGETVAAGKTVDRIQSEIQTSLRKRFPRAECFVLLTKIRPAFFSVIGEVAKGGQFPLTDNLSLREAISLAGGPAQRPELLQALLFRDGKLVETFDLYNVAATEDPTGAKIVQPGDVISIQTLRQLRVWSSGLTRRPGMATVENGTTLRQFIAWSANPGETELREQIVVSVLRDGHEILQAALYDIETGKTAEFAIQDGDFISIAMPETHRVWVLGAVAEPGQKDLPVGSPVARAIAASGGTADGASLRNIRVIRGNEEIEVDLRNEPQGIAIEQGDLIIVSSNTRRVAVMGEVNSPGLYTMRDDDEMHLSDAIGLAGGLTPRGPANRLMIVRIQPNGEVAKIPVDFSKYLRGEDGSLNPILQSGDIVFAGETPRIEFDKVISALVTAVGIGNILRR